MLTSVIVLASVATLVRNEVTTTSLETEEHVNVTNATSNTDIDFLFADPEVPTVSAVVSPVTYGSGPHWSHETQTLYYVSILGKTLMKYLDGSHFKAKLDGMPTFIIPIEGKMNTFAVGLDQKVVEIQWNGTLNGAKVLGTIAEVHMEHPEDRFSHGKADPRGRLFAGSMSHNNDPARTNKKRGALYRFAEDGTPQKVLNNIDVSNGFCWDLAHKAFYLIDNFNYSIRRYDYDVETGHISNPQIVFAMQDQEYIVAYARSYGQVTQYGLPNDSVEPNNLGGPQGSAPGGPQGYVKSGPPIGRQGNTQNYDQGTQGGLQGDPQSNEIYKNLGGLLDRDDYYENKDFSGSEIDATDGGDAEGGSEGVAPGGPGYVKGDPQIRRQGDLQVFAPGGPQDYGPGGPQDYSPGGPQDQAPGGPQDYGPGGPQDQAPGGPQDYGPGGTQDYGPSGPQGYGPGGPQDYGPGGPQGYGPGGPQDYGPEDFHSFAPGGRQGYPSKSSIRTKGVEKGGSYKKKLSGTLDGMTIDTDGNLWVANYNGSQVLKIDPNEGKLLLVIPIDTLLVTSVTFGGPELDVLYVTSAATDRMDKKEQRSPAGTTFSIISTGAKGHLNNNVRFT